MTMHNVNRVRFRLRRTLHQAAEGPERITVVSMPARSPNNRYFRLFSESLRDAGVEVAGIRDRTALGGTFDILHIHFPAYFHSRQRADAAVLCSLLFVGLLATAKLLGKRVVYTVHNVRPTGIYRGWLYGPFIRMVHRLCDAYVFLSASSQADFYTAYPDQQTKTSATIPHGPYPTAAMPIELRRQRRLELGGGEGVFLIGILGDIKPYKGLEILRRLPTHLTDGRSIRVVVAGRIEAGYERAAEALLAIVPPNALTRINERLSDADLDAVIESVDLVVLPYSRGTNSGFAHLVLSNRVNLLGSDLPVFLDLEQLLGSPWVHTYASDPAAVGHSFANALDLAASVPPTAEDVHRLERYLGESSFVAGAVRLRKLYAQLLGSPGEHA